MFNLVLIAFALLGGRSRPVVHCFPLFRSRNGIILQFYTKDHIVESANSVRDKNMVRYSKPVRQNWSNSRFGLVEKVFVIWNKKVKRKIREQFK